MTEYPVEMCASARGFFRVIIIVVNAVLVVVGAACLAAGIWLLTAEQSFFYRHHDVIVTSDVSEQQVLKDGVIAVMACGAALLTFCGLGMVAACTSSPCLLALWMSRLDREVSLSLHTKYGGQSSTRDRDFTAAWDHLQSDYQCCGWYNGSDYVTQGKAPQKWNASTGVGRKMMVPESCCPSDNSTVRDKCVTMSQSSDVYSAVGCRDAVRNVLTTHQWLIIGMGAGTLALEILMVISSVLMLSLPMNNKYNLS